MKKFRFASLACTAAVFGAGIGAAPPTAADHMTHVVRPGESIQAAVDAAKSGDTVLLTAGTFYESVKVSTPGLTLRGMGRLTVIKPVPGTAPAATPSSAESTASTAPATCAEGGNGVCVIGTRNRYVENVTVASLTVTGFTRAGVFSMGTDRLTVRNVRAVQNGLWGIAQERSVRGVIRDNVARDNGDAGVFLANSIKTEQGASDTQGTLVARNHLAGNRIGVTVRRLRNLTVQGNHVTGNCAGVFVVGDENKPKTGALTVSDNRVVSNNKSCPANSRLEALQGSGIVVTGAEDTLVTRNVVRDNAGASSLSGGIVLFKSFVGTANERNRVSGNTLSGNSPADLVNTEAGGGNTFEGNSCRASKPAGLC
ncbi:right-handed parallel beta-helix repeat-containing protein [Streptomyces sp. NPDC048002]|uniref:right-handed parallel beta-helix repeat-containing protein n=1 Tax=Streptomyces sp. NPDC048002 TaxID=3154344 RepID=UPI0033D9C211